MACNRCEDVHNAQRSGDTQKGCECLCHDFNIYPTYIPWTPFYSPQPIYQPYPVVYTGDTDPTFALDTGTTITSCEDGKCSTLKLN